MCRNVCTTLAPPVCPSSSIESGVASESAGVALWERYYGLYDEFIGVARRSVGNARDGDNGVGGLLLGSGSGGESLDRDRLCLPGFASSLCDCAQATGCHLCGRGVNGDVYGPPGREYDSVSGTRVNHHEHVSDAHHAREPNIDEAIGSSPSSDDTSRERVIRDASKLRDDNHVGDGIGIAEDRKLPLRGANYERNRLNREKKKEKKKNLKMSCGVKEDATKSNFRGFFSNCDSDIQAQLASTRAARLIAENKYAAEKFEHNLIIARGLDSESEIKKRKLATRASIEKSMVSMEKAHATLVATGNVPTEIGGFAATINSGSISPDSSASLAELRKCQKDLLDSCEKNERLTAALINAGVEVPRGAATERDEDRANDLWTDNTENMQYLDDNLSAFAVQRDYCGTGKMRICPG